MSEDETEETKQCIAKTNSGNRCKMNAVNGSDYCVNPAHGSDEDEDEELQTEESSLPFPYRMVEEEEEVGEVDEETIEISEDFDDDVDILHNVERSDIIVEHPKSVVWQVKALNVDGSIQVELVSDEDPIGNCENGSVSRWCYNEICAGLSDGDLVVYDHPELADN